MHVIDDRLNRLSVGAEVDRSQYEEIAEQHGLSARAARLLPVVDFLASIAGSSTPVQGSDDPMGADAAVRRSSFVRELEEVVPEVFSGHGTQVWLETGTRGAIRRGVLDPIAFTPVASTTPLLNVKPAGAGLFTSTAFADTFGMWHLYLCLEGFAGLQGPLLSAWQLHRSPGARVLDVHSAVEWVQLVAAHPRPSRGVLRPDWFSIAESFDAVHIGLAAVLATQAVEYQIDAGAVAAPTWDAETTVWLRWAFEEVERVDAAE